MLEHRGHDLLAMLAQPRHQAYLHRLLDLLLRNNRLQERRLSNFIDLGLVRKKSRSCRLDSLLISRLDHGCVVGGVGPASDHGRGLLLARPVRLLL